MRTFRTLLVAALCAVPLTAIAQDYPKLKPGLWEMTRSSDRTPGQSSSTTVCLDETVQKEMFEMSTGAMKGMCSKHDFRLSGNHGTGDFVCDIGGSRMHSTSELFIDSASGYRTEIHTTYEPPFMGQTESKTVLTARNLGPCKPGQRPGDMTMPNGRTINMHDAMGGAKR
jgi:hypothetical protein